MKKVGIEMSHYGVMGGYGVVATNIINELLKNNECEFYLLSTEEKKLPDDLKNKKNIHWVISNIKSYYLHRLWVESSLLKKYNIDIFYTPDQIVPLRKVCRYISTIHDLFFYQNYSGIKSFKLLKRRDRLWIYQLVHLDKYFAKKSDIIITPSTASKIDILSEFSLQESKVKVAFWGMNHCLPNIKKLNSKKYLLFPLCADVENHFIFRLGEEILGNKIIDEIVYWKPSCNEGGKIPAINNKNMRIINKRISEEEKISLLSNASLCIYISEFEGFGFVPLECLFYGSPLIYHNVGSLEEIIGDSGIGIKSYKINDYINAIKEIYLNRKIFVQKGYNCVTQYSWDKTVKVVLDSLNL